MHRAVRYQSTTHSPHPTSRLHREQGDVHTHLAHNHLEESGLARSIGTNHPHNACSAAQFNVVHGQKQNEGS